MTSYERKWSAPELPYRIEGGRVLTDGTHVQKITGTSMGGLLNLSPWATPFSASTKLMGVWDEDIGDKPQVVAGKLLEGRIIDYVCANYRGQYYHAEDIYGKREGAHKDWASDFEDEVYAGHIDGIVTVDGEDYILEVKTTSPNGAKGWEQHPPEYYLWQVYLYNAFLTKKDKAYMALGVIDPQFYGNPNAWIPDKSNTFLFEVPIDQKMVNETLEKLRAVYNETIRKGISLPAGDNEIDNEVLQHLRDIQMESEDIQKLVKEYVTIKKQNQAYLDMNRENIEKEEELKARVKDILTTNDLNRAGDVKITTSVRKSFDFKTADVDGFDYSKYLKTTTVNTLNVIKED